MPQFKPKMLYSCRRDKSRHPIYHHQKQTLGTFSNNNETAKSIVSFILRYGQSHNLDKNIVQKVKDLELK